MNIIKFIEKYKFRFNCLFLVDQCATKDCGNGVCDRLTGECDYSTTTTEDPVTTTTTTTSTTTTSTTDYYNDYYYDDYYR